MKFQTKKKILFRIGSLQGGGAEKSLIMLLRYLNYSKYEVDLLLNCRTGVYLNKLPKEVGLFYLGNGNEFLSRLFVFRFFQKLWRRLRYEFYKYFPYFLYRCKLKCKKYDLEIGFLHDIIPLLIKSPLTSKKIAWIHDDLRANYYDNSRKIMLSAFKKMNIIVAVSRQCKDVLLSLLPELNNKTKIIYNGINLNEVVQKSQESIPRKKTNALQLVAIGRLSVVQKSFDRLIRVCHRLRQEGLDFGLWIIGEGPDREKLAHQIKNLHLESTVELLGYKENPYPYLNAADLFMLSSHYEALPYVVLEALILNKPIVSTDITGPRELLRDGQYGLLVENSEEELYKGIKKMIADKEFREFFAKKEKNFSAFDPKNIVRQVEELIDELCKN